jgi:hypothetical protein
MDETWPQPYTQHHADIWVKGQEEYTGPHASVAIVDITDDTLVLGGEAPLSLARDLSQCDRLGV